MLASCFAFIYGIVFGSFLNVLIYRLPQEKGIVTRSRCPHCDSPIRWFHNIPLLSFIWLRGRCSQCRGAISWRYPLVELLTGIGFWFFFPSDHSWEAMCIYAFYMAVLCIFIAHFFIDLKHQILPDSLNLILGALMLAYAIPHFEWWYWLGGSALGLLLTLGVTWGFYLLRGQIGLGGGDIKLYAALGLYLGPKGIMENIFLSCFLGAFVGIALILMKRLNKDRPIPFGPFILIVAFVQIFLPELAAIVRFF